MLQVNVTRDDVLCQEYAAVPQTVDQIIKDADVGEEFRERVNSQLALADQFGLSELNDRLLYLRKRSRLVRKQRQYNGRNRKPR